MDDLYCACHMMTSFRSLTVASSHDHCIIYIYNYVSIIILHVCIQELARSQRTLLFDGCDLSLVQTVQLQDDMTTHL
jgi:hypothetical protein